MPAQNQRVSRRSLLRGAAGASAVGLAAASGAVALAGPVATAGPDHQGPVMVYLRDAATGELDVFAGTRQVTLRDPALAKQLIRAIQ
jgi:hypothetical protein